MYTITKMVWTCEICVENYDDYNHTITWEKSSYDLEVLKKSTASFLWYSIYKQGEDNDYETPFDNKEQIFRDLNILHFPMKKLIEDYELGYNDKNYDDDDKFPMRDFNDNPLWWTTTESKVCYRVYMFWKDVPVSKTSWLLDACTQAV